MDGWIETSHGWQEAWGYMPAPAASLRMGRLVPLHRFSTTARRVVCFMISVGRGCVIQYAAMSVSCGCTCTGRGKPLLL
jgi:hypothetical protein